MGFFDLPAPIFSLLDRLLVFLPDLVKLIIWGLVAGYGTMWLFKRFSNQEKIQGLKIQVKKNQKKMAAFEGEINELLPLIGQTLKLAFKQLGAALGPALLVSIPVIFILAWLSNSYSLKQPEASEVYQAEVITLSDSNFSSAEYNLGNKAQTRWLENDSAWEFSWPAEGKPLTLNHSSANILSISADKVTNIVHKKQWWNWLVGNTMGYLPADSNIDQIIFNFEENKILEMGPGWMHGWMFPFFLSFLIFSLAFKFILKIA